VKYDLNLNTMEFLARKTLVTIAVVFMMVLASDAQVVEDLPATDMKEPTSKQDTLKKEPQPDEKSLKEVAPEKAEQGGKGEASAAGEDQKKVGEETSNAKDGASSFVATGSSSSASPPVDNQEIPPPGKQKPTESNENNKKEDSGSGKAAVNDEQPKIAKLEEAGKDEAAPQEEAAKGPDPDPVQEADPADSEISKKEDGVMGAVAPEVKEESAVDKPMETSFEKQMGSGAADPPQSNFFSYFIVLAIITIIAYLVFHNKKKILGLIVEGRSGRQAGRRRSGGREYRKLDSNVEDMMETGRETSMRQVIY